MTVHRRPTWDDYFLEMAKLAATRSTCPRRRVGAVLTRDDRRTLLASGYNGAIRGAAHCEDVGCLLVDGHCVRAVHAELNAILQCAVNGVSTLGASLYSTDFPCVHCAKAIVQAGITRVVFLAPYPDEHSTEVLEAGGVTLFQATRIVGGYAVQPV